MTAWMRSSSSLDVQRDFALVMVVVTALALCAKRQLPVYLAVSQTRLDMLCNDYVAFPRWDLGTSRHRSEVGMAW